MLQEKFILVAAMPRYELYLSAYKKLIKDILNFIGFYWIVRDELSE
jgi:hypothetical protein